MSNRKPITEFKHKPYVGLFQYPWLPLSARIAMKTPGYLLPPNNPYVGFFDNSKKREESMSTGRCTRDACTQTEVCHAIEIGEKIIEAYGEEYTLLLK